MGMGRNNNTHRRNFGGGDDMKLRNQDHDKTYDYEGQELNSAPVLSPDGELWGFNLHIDGVTELLGTFDSLEEIMSEMTAIKACEDDAYTISGYSDYDSAEDIEELCDYVDSLKGYE